MLGSDIRCRHISTHSLTKRLTERIRNEVWRSIISTHSLTKRLTMESNRGRKSKWNFNSQPHEEADGQTAAKENLEYTISTHSLTKRLTNGKKQWKIVIKFQLTASRRGWRRILAALHSRSHFNSQPHEEADELPAEKPALSDISTHSLTKRLTSGFPLIRFLNEFQLTASRRGWRS